MREGAPAAHGKALAGVPCATPPPAHCDGACARELLGNQGNVIEPKTGRAFFLDYPCDLKADEQVIVILNLHGAGSIGNWQRHYFPALDYKDKYRLVVATPTAAGPARLGRALRLSACGWPHPTTPNFRTGRSC
jgi:hypothetical protein